jgi:2,3-bisphosphoglycerate-dependent phosphoglycerate mutase
MLDSAQLFTLYKKYSKEKVDSAIAFLSYKDAQSLPKTEIFGFPVLYVFRHGQTEDNANFIFSGWRDSDLTEAGKTQALDLAPKLKGKNIAMLFTSDQIRSIKTMQLAMTQNPYAGTLTMTKDPRIKERSYGDLQGKSKLIMQLEKPEQLSEYRRSYTKVPPNGESLEIVVKRVYEFIEDLIPRMKQFNVNVAVSCHGNSIRGFRKYFEHLTDERCAEIETPLGQDYAAYSIQ